MPAGFKICQKTEIWDIKMPPGSPVSVSFKTFLNDSNNAVEAFASVRTQSVGSITNTRYRWTWFGVGAAYQVHNPLEIHDGMSYLPPAWIQESNTGRVGDPRSAKAPRSAELRQVEAGAK